MAEIRPFRGVRYNQELAKELADIICPPYDVIDPQLQQELYHRSPYNFVRIEAGRELAQDTNTDNKYTRAASTLEQWLKDGVLAADPTPAIYIHDHYFSYEGRELRRRAIVAGVRLEEWDKRVVRPHEGILAEHKGDRFSLLWALKANTSPILALFQDRGGRVSSLLAQAGQGGHPHVQAGIEWLLARQDHAGRWALEQVPGKMWASFGQVGQPNKWVTLRALQLLKNVLC